VEQTSGVGLEHWLALACRHTRLERRTLLRAARWTSGCPRSADGLISGRLSWTQARTLTLTLRDLPAGHDPRPTSCSPAARRVAGRCRPRRDRRAAAPGDLPLADALTPDDVPPVGNRLAIQPRLDGTGGTFHGEADAVGLAILDDATAPTRDQLDHPGGIAGARADNLLGRLTHTCDGGDARDDGDRTPGAAGCRR
jgi:hypothetical protein